MLTGVLKYYMYAQFHQKQVRNLYLLVLGQITILYMFFIFYMYIYYELLWCVKNSVDPDQLQKPADLELHGFQMWFHTVL